MDTKTTVTTPDGTEVPFEDAIKAQLIGKGYVPHISKGIAGSESWEKVGTHFEWPDAAVIVSFLVFVGFVLWLLIGR